VLANKTDVGKEKCFVNLMPEQLTLAECCEKARINMRMRKKKWN